MDEGGNAALEVGFVIDTGGSFDELAQLQRIMGSAEAQIVADAAKIEKATGGMVSLGGATAQVSSFSSASTKAMRDLVREQANAERGGERLAAGLTRQAENFGKTSSEIRQMRAELAATRAESAGLTELAGRIRAASAQLDTLEASGGRAAGGIGQTRGAMAALAPQAQDAFTQVSMGTNILSVLAIQGGQAAGQMVYMGGTLGKVASFMLGPWGLAFTAGLLVVGALTKGIFDNNSALDEELEKLKKNAAEQDAARIAKERFATTTEGARQALLEYKDALDQVDNSLKSEAERTRDAIDLKLNETIASRENTRAIYEEAKAYEARFTSRLREQLGGEGAAGFDIAAGQAAGRVASLQSEIDKQVGIISGLRTQLGRAQSNVDVELGRQANDPLEQIRKRYEGADGLIEQARKRAIAEGKVGDALQRQVTAIDAAMRKEIEAQQKRDSASRRTTTPGVSTFTSRQQAIGLAGKELQGAGFRVDGNVQFGYTGGHANNADHNQFAADVNVGKGVVEANVPDLKKRFDELARLYQARGFDVVWNRQFYGAGGNGPTGSAKGHENHLHLKAPSTIVGKATQSSSARQALTEQARILADQKREYDNAVKGAEDYIAAQAKVAETTGFTAEELRRYADAAAIAKAPTEDLKKAIQAAADQREKSLAAQSGKDFDTNVLEPLRDEIALYGLVGSAREIAALDLEKEAFLAKQVGVDVAAANKRWEEYAKLKMQLIANGAVLEQEEEAVRRLNDELGYIAETWDLIARNVDTAAQGMSEAFGEVGAAIGDMAAIYSGFQADQARLDAQHIARLNEIKLAKGGSTAIERENAKFALATANSQIGLYGDMAAAAKGFFDEKSAGYRAVMAAEKVFRAFEFAMSIRSMLQDASETITSITNSGARAAAAGAEGVATQSKLPFPFNIAAMAATGAALIAAGIAVLGSGSGSAASAPVTNQGKGTVLGDPEAQSQSIKRSLDALKEIDVLMLNASREMAASLRSIDRQIGGVASQILREGDISASGGVTEGFKPNLIGSVLGAIPLVGGLLKSLFGSTTTVTGSGIFGGPQSLGSILNGGFDASYYSDIQKKSKFLGITTGTKNSTQFTGADGALEGQFTLILSEFAKAISAAADPLGIATSEIEQRLNGFVINIGKIELKGLTGEQVQEKLAAVFGAAADQMARTAFPGIERFQKAGEGLFETVVRVSSTVEQITASLGMLGNATVGLGIDAKVALADQFESLGALSSATQTYFDRFYTAQEQAAARAAQFEGVFASLGLTLPSTLAGFRALVDAQDLASASGRETYATLIQLAPAFADLQSALTGARSAAEILSERMDLERKLLEVQGNTAAIRALDLAKLDPGNHALQQQIWALQDAQEAASAADDLRKAWTDVGTSIADEVRRIRGLANGGAGNSFASAMGQFNAATAAARGGDLDAAKSLPGLSQALLALAADNATSRQELDRVQAQTASSLEQTMRLIAGLSGSAAPQTAGSLIAQISGTQPASAASANDNTAVILREELVALREDFAAFRKENASGQATIASHTGKTKTILENVTAPTGGDSIATANAA